MLRRFDKSLSGSLVVALLAGVLLFGATGCDEDWLDLRNLVFDLGYDYSTADDSAGSWDTGITDEGEMEIPYAVGERISCDPYG